MNADAYPLPDFTYEPLRPFWEAAARKRLELPRCANCKHFNWYPAEHCAHCNGTQFDWIELKPAGKIFSWSVVNRPLFPPYAAIAPYIPVIVELDDAPDVRLVTRLIESDTAQIAMGAAVAIVFEDFTYPHNPSGHLAPLVKLQPPR